MIYLFTELSTKTYYMDVASYCDVHTHYFFYNNKIYKTKSARANEIDATRLGIWRTYNADNGSIYPLFGMEWFIFEDNKLPDILKIYDLKSYTPDIERMALISIEEAIYDSI